MTARTGPSVLFGAGDQAAHILSLMEWSGLPTADVVLFDDAFRAKRVGPRDRPVLGSLSDGIAHCVRTGATAMVALGSRRAAIRYGLFRQLRQVGVRLDTLVHPSCVIAPTARVADNVIIMAGTTVGSAVTLGSMCSLYLGVTLEHDTVVADNAMLGPGVTTAGDVRIGAHAFIGAGAVIAPFVRIGERALIGAGAVVVSDIPDGVIATGVPARVQREAPSGLDVPTLEELAQLPHFEAVRVVDPGR